MISKKKIREMRMEGIGMDNECKTWDDESNNALSRMYYNGTELSEIAYKLKRSESAIAQRITQMDLNAKTKKTRSRKVKLIGCLCNECIIRDSCYSYKEKGICTKPEGEDCSMAS
jgi:hypothetical protein